MPPGRCLSYTLLLLASVAVSLGRGQDAAGSVCVAQGEAAGAASAAGCTLTFGEALRDQRVTRIRVASPTYKLNEAELGPLGAPPIEINRNLTISGDGASVTVLDQQLHHARVQLCPACVVTFANLTIANDTRITGPGNELFFSRGGASVVLRGGNLLRIACPPASETRKTIKQTPRAQQWPGSNANAPTELRDVTIQGRLYPSQLWVDGYAAEVAKPSAPVFEDRAGGYAIVFENQLRVCVAEFEPACLMHKTSEQCVSDLKAAMKGSQAGGGPDRTAVLALAVALPLGVALAAALAGVVCWRRRRARQVQQANLWEPSTLTSMDSAMEVGKVGSGSVALSLLAPSSTNMPPQQQGQQQGWRMHSTQSSAAPWWGGPTCDLSIEWGALLGTGSFGKVYRASFGGRDVAVKVIEHTRNEQEKIANEVGLMLSFNHPCIVRAFASFTRERESLGGVRSTSCSSGTGSRPHGSADAFGASLDAAGCSPSALLPRAATSKSGQGGTAPAHAAAPSRYSGGSGGQRQPGSIAPEGGMLGSRDSVGTDDGATLGASGQQQTWLVLELCDRGSLGQVAAQWLPEAEGDAQMLARLQLLADCASGLQELHSKGVIHGDLNARNVLVASSPGGLKAKLADLGLSRRLREQHTHRTTNTLGTLTHLAPELLRFGRMSPAIDIYAFAITMHEIYTRGPAFGKGQGLGQLIDWVVYQHVRPTVPDGCPADYALLMQSCWTADPAARPSASRLLACLQVMIADRQQRLAQAAPGTSSSGSTSSSSEPALLAWAREHAPEMLAAAKQGRSRGSNGQPPGELLPPDEGQAFGGFGCAAAAAGSPQPTPVLRVPHGQREAERPSRLAAGRQGSAPPDGADGLDDGGGLGELDALRWVV